MKKFIFENIDEKCNKDEIIWENLKVADECGEFSYFSLSADSWFKENPDKNFQDLEVQLRKRNFSTHLIAVDSQQRDGIKLISLNKLPYKPLYEICYSCRREPYAMEELLSHSKSYEENFEKLGKCGILTSDTVHVEEKSKKDSNFIKIEDDNFTKLNEAKVKLKVIHISESDFLHNLYEELKEKHGKCPKNKLICMGANCGPIFSFVIDDIIVTNWAYYIIPPNEYRIVNLSKMNILF